MSFFIYIYECYTPYCNPLVIDHIIIWSLSIYYNANRRRRRHRRPYLNCTSSLLCIRTVYVCLKCTHSKSIAPTPTVLFLVEQPSSNYPLGIQLKLQSQMDKISLVLP